MTTWVAFVAVAVSIEDPPDETEVGLAPRVTVGGLTAPPTVTVAVAVALAPPSPVAVAVYVVVADGDTLWVPPGGDSV
jgi:hypothetical protein